MVYDKVGSFISQVSSCCSSHEHAYMLKVTSSILAPEHCSEIAMGGLLPSRRALAHAVGLHFDELSQWMSSQTCDESREGT